MQIEIKNLKHFESGSHETHCFTATVYVDGERFCTAENDGRGGPDNYHPIAPKTQQDMRALHEAIKADPAHKWEADGRTFDGSLEIIICGLINDQLADKEVKRVLRRVSYMDGNAIYQCAAKIKPTPENLAMVKRQKWWEPKFVMLNELPFEDAKAKILAAA